VRFRGTTILADTDQVWYAAREVLAGRDPYDTMGPGRPVEYRYPLYYPLTTVVATLPLATLPLWFSRAVLIAAPAAWFAWTLTARERWRGLWLAGWPFVEAVSVGQWSPFMMAAALTPAAGWLLVLKPQLAVAWLLATLSRRLFLQVAVAGAVLGAITFAIDPGWLGSWRATVAGADHMRVLGLRPVGLVLLLALTRWRRLEARALLAVAAVPITPMPYELLPLGLVPATPRQTVALVVAALVARLATIPILLHVPFADRPSVAADLLVVGLCWPALLMVLRRPNEGTVPEWTANIAARLMPASWRATAEHAGRRHERR
jgi:hypothetical protein